MFKRSSGVLLHPSSLPGAFGIGTLGQEAYDWVNFLVASKQRYWQILPLGPTGFGNSPYQCFSAFAGNALLIDLQQLVAMGLLPSEALHVSDDFGADAVDYEAVIAHKEPLLKAAYENFNTKNYEDYGRFISEHASWLEDYALFMALYEHFEKVSWSCWNEALRHRDPKTLRHYEEKLCDAIGYHRFVQYLFFRQWDDVKRYANARGVAIIGDIPIYVSYESADVWKHAELFELGADSLPTHVAGVPPDYFSATGQRWGNPLFDWKQMQDGNFAWWLDRLGHNLALFDAVRIDHFRGFEAYWSIPAEEETAINGEWIKAPGEALFEAIKTRFGALPIIAEDLGIITPEVEALRDAFGLPGMKILQFAFDGNFNNAYLPHNCVNNCIYYTGTHDNNTVLGWFYGPEGSHASKQLALEYLGVHHETLHWDFIRCIYASVANVAIVPLQDILGYGNACRMNTPGTVEGNWEWRYEKSALNEELAARLGRMVTLYGRES